MEAETGDASVPQLQGPFIRRAQSRLNGSTRAGKKNCGQRIRYTTVAEKRRNLGKANGGGFTLQNMEVHLRGYQQALVTSLSY